MTALTPANPDFALQQNNAAQYPPTTRAVRHIVAFLQRRFSLLPVGAYHWELDDRDSPDGPRSEIYIASDTPLPGRDIGNRPAITVLRSQLQFQGVGMGDVVDHNWQTGGKTYMDLMPTTICINVLSRLDFVAERLAFFVQEQIFTLREEIMRTEKCIFSIGQRTTMGAPSPAGALIDSTDPDWINVPLFLPTFLQHATSFTPINVPVVQKIQASVAEAKASKP